MRIIAVCLKEEANIPYIGCAILNSNSVESICCISEHSPMQVFEVTPEEFTANITQSIEKKEEPVFTNFSSDNVIQDVNTMVSTRALRSMKGTTLFKKSMSPIFLAKHNYITYIWYSGKYFAINESSLSKKKKTSYTSEDLENTLTLKMAKSVYDFLSGDELKKSVHDSIVYMVRELGMDIEEAQNFILDSFNYTSKYFNVKLHKTKLKHLLGLNAKGPSGKVNLENLDTDNYISPEMIEESDDEKLELADVVDCIDNIESVEVNTGFNPTGMADIGNLLDIAKSEFEEKLNEYKKDVVYEVVTTGVRNEDGEQEVVVMTEDTKPILDEIAEASKVEETLVGDEFCTKCNGKGYYEEEHFGVPMQIKCSCVDKLKEIKSSKESSVKGKFKNPESTRAIHLEALDKGLIPRRRLNDVLDFREMGDRVASICKENGEKITDMASFEAYKSAMRDVLGYILSERNLDYSLCLSAPNGFGKTTFVYTCLKFLLKNPNAKIVPYISLMELAQLRYDYMNNISWRHLDRNNRTETELQIEKEASYGRILTNNYVYSNERDLYNTQEEVTRKPLIEMTDFEKDSYVFDKKHKSYTYKDYLDADVLFCQLSVAEQAYLEISTLKAILDYRGLRCKPTIILTDRNIEAYKKTIGMATDVHLLNDMLTKNLKFATYDRAYLITVTKERARKIKHKPGETV